MYVAFPVHWAGQLALTLSFKLFHTKRNELAEREFFQGIDYYFSLADFTESNPASSSSCSIDESVKPGGFLECGILL